MAYFARQKRQSRFYWAELGFMALGLLGLQPSLFTHLIMGSQAKSRSYADPFYQTLQNQPIDLYRELASTRLAAYYPTQHLSGQAYSGQALMPSMSTTYGQNLSYGQISPNQIAQNQIAQYQFALPYQQLGTFSPAYHASGPYAQQPQTPQYAQYPPPSHPTASYAWQSQPSYLAQANSGYSTFGNSGVANSEQWSASQANNYGNRVVNIQPRTANSNNSFANAGSYPYNLHAPRGLQQSLFDNGYNSNNYATGRANAASSPESYSYPSSSAKPSTWQRYQPTNPIYR